MTAATTIIGLLPLAIGSASVSAACSTTRWRAR